MTDGDDLVGVAEVRAAFRLWSKPSTDFATSVNDEIGRRDDRRIARLCSALELHLAHKEAEFRDRHRHSPILVCFQSDATSYLTMWRNILKRLDGPSLQRQSHDLCEFLIQRLFLAAPQGEAVSQSLAVLRPPRLLRHGKTASVHAEAMREHVVHPFAKHPRHSICISFYSWDRAIFSACFRLAQQRHRLFWETDAIPLYGEFRHVAKHRDIVLGAGCSLHDISGGLRWATQSFLDAAEMKNLYNLVEGLRNGARYLHKILDAFIVSHVQFDEGDSDCSGAEAFWATLGICGDMLREFASLNPRWDGQTLWINGAERSAGDIFGRIMAVVAYPWCWRRYNSARFLILGSGSRMLLQARLLGLDRIVAMGRASPCASDYWLHHYAALDERMCRFFVVCGLGACVADSLMVAVMVDARIPRQCQSLGVILQEQIEQLGRVPSDIWRRLATSVGADESWSALRHDAMQVANVSAAWVDQKVLALARRLPWSLCAGDLRANVRSLKHLCADNLDPATKSLQFIVKSGAATEDELVAALFIMGEAPWTTMDSEQSHGSLAIQHRYHRDLSAEVLCLRGYLHMCRAFFSPPPEEVAAARLQQRLDRLHCKNPNMIRGSGVFAGEVLAIVKSTLGDDSARGLPFWQGQMASAMHKWKELGVAEKSRFDCLAQISREQKRRAIDDAKEQLAAAIVMLRKQQRESAASGAKHTIGANRFTDRDLASLTAVIRVVPESRQATEKYLSQVRRPAMPLQLNLASQFALQPSARYDVAREGPPPLWVKIAARNRDAFQDTCFVRLDSASREVVEALLFLVGVQSPLGVLFQRLVHRCPLIELSEGLEIEPPPPAPSFEHLFSMVPGAWVSDMDVAVDPQEHEWFLLPSVSHIAGGWLASDAPYVPWSVFVRNMLHECRDQPARTKTTGSRAKRADLPPWVCQWLGTPPERRPSESNNHLAQLPAEATPLTKEQEDEVDMELAAMRAWLSSMLPEGDYHFSVRVLGGKWTRKNRHLTWDAIQGYARTNDAKLFCDSYGLNQSMRFGAQEHGRDDGMLLAWHWAQRMAYFYEMWEATDFAAIEFSEADASAHDDLELITAMLAAGTESALWARGSEIRATVPGPYREPE